MGAKSGKILKTLPEQEDMKLKKSKTLPNNFEKPQNKENLIWLDYNVGNAENSFYLKEIGIINKFKLFTFQKTEDCITKLKTIKFEKTTIIVSGGLSKEFFMEFQNKIDTIFLCPIIIIFTSKSKLNLIKANIISLDKFYLFDPNLVFDDFFKVHEKLLSEDEYKPHYFDLKKTEEKDVCFSFEYIKDLKELIFPLTFIEFMEMPTKFEIIDFNQFLLDKYSKHNSQMDDLIRQLLIDIKIPLQILVKYWIRAYTFPSNFYKEMNNSLIGKDNNKNDYDVFIRVLYQALQKKIIKPLINKTLYRGAYINKKEIELLQESLVNKKEDEPRCICYNKAFLSTSLEKNVAFQFINKKPFKEYVRVLYIITEGKQLDEESATNTDIQEFSYFQNEKEILLFPFSCFEIIEVKYENNNIIDYYQVNLNYLGKYKDKINISEAIPETNFVKNILSSNMLEKLEMSKESNKKKFDFDIEKYVQDIKQSFIIAIYDITEENINKNIQIMNCDENINKDELKKICKIKINDEQKDLVFDYKFDSPGKYNIIFKFNHLLKKANKLFYGCKTLISLNFQRFKSNYIVNMTDMFNGCEKLESLDLSNFKTKEVISMKNMFKGCKSLNFLDVSSFDTNNVTDMSEMFSECSSLTFLNLSNFKTNKVKSMHKMFYKCSSMIYINLSSFQSDKINNISEMFSGCSSLKNMDLSNFDINENMNTENMFYNCSYFTSLRDDFIKEITDDNINIVMKKVSKEFLENEGKRISKYIQNFIKNKKNDNFEILNQSIEDLIHKIKHINIILLGEFSDNNNKLIKTISKQNEGNLNPIINDNNECYDLGFFKIYNIEEIKENNIDKISQKVEYIISNLNKDIESSIHFIWFYISGATLNNNMNDLLNKIIKKYKNKIPIFIIHLNTKENEQKDDFDKFKENINKIYENKKLEIFPISIENKDENEQSEKLINITKNNFINVLYQDIHDKSNIMTIVKNKIEKIEVEKDLDDLPNCILKYFEKILGKRDEIISYLSKDLELMLNYSKRAIDTDTITYFIDNFKLEKLKLKVVKTKKIDLDNFDNDLNKELKKHYSQISKKYYQEKFNEEVYNFFLNFYKVEAEKIIAQTIKDMKIDDLKPLIEKNLVI